MLNYRFTRARGWRLLPSLLFCALATRVQADVRLAGVFGDHMVLQRDVRLAVWGEAAPGETVVVKVAGQSASTKAGGDGQWRVTLNPLKPADQAIEFTVAGANTVVLEDVLVGDVWLCAGQSNLVYPLYKDRTAAEEMPKANHPELRLCRVSTRGAREPVRDRKLAWEACTPETARTFSAVSYFFGRDLQASLKVPVGLICSAVSGTAAESWTSLDGLRSDPALKIYLDARDQMNAKPTPGTNQEAAAAGMPTALFNGMISPLIPFGLRGIAWYQGESNAGAAEVYRRLFPALIADWRRHWDQPNLPFLFVQLPGFGRRQPEPEPSKWAALREAQTMALSVPNTGMAVTLDLAAPRNLLHTANKREIGRRLALIAEGMVYGQNVVCAGPVYKSVKIEGGKARVTFDNAGSGLMAGTPVPTDANEPVAAPGLALKGFALAGTNQVFAWADAEIDGNAVVVSSDAVRSPVAVRYGWNENPEVNLYRREGLPAAPFRTDDWPLRFPAAEAADKAGTNASAQF